MSIDVNWQDSSTFNGKHFLAQERNRHVLLETASLTALGVPADGTEKFATLTYAVNAAGTSDNPVQTVAAGFGAVGSASFTRTNDTSAYAVGDLVANSTVAASVSAIQIVNAVREVGGVSRCERLRLQKSGTSITNASFRIHLYASNPVPSNGDNGAFLTPIAGYIGAFDVTMDRIFTNGATGAGVPMSGSALTFTIPSGTTLFALIEARGAYTPTSGETFTVIAELYRF
jgi:hypothetical protein